MVLERLVRLRIREVDYLVMSNVDHKIRLTDQFSKIVLPFEAYIVIGNQINDVNSFITYYQQKQTSINFS